MTNRLMSILLLNALTLIYGLKRDQKCEEISVPLCVGIGYNLTKMPNQFHHQTQEEAGLEAHQFWPLVQIQCSPYLKFLLCSMYVPICIITYPKPVPPCRSVCEKAKSGCEPLMEKYGFSWPNRMKCNQFPEVEVNKVCMDFNISEPTKPERKCSCRCTNSYVKVPRTHHLYDKIGTGGVLNCAESCHSPHFNADERKFSEFWIGLWSVLCCISTLMTVLTFLVDRTRFRYPERPIVFLSASYLIVSVGYIIRLIVGHEKVACDEKMLRYGSSNNAICTTVFLLIYAGSNAASVWWVILTFTWFLAAAIKWGQEAIASYATYFHIAAWIIPSAQTIAILSLSLIDGDSVSGICSVGNTSLAAFRGFVLAPQIVYLALGSIFLLTGFMSLCRIRSVIKAQGRNKTDKLEKLMIRILVFSVLYTLPAATVIGCLFYEERQRLNWQRGSLNCRNCPTTSKPNFSLFMLRYFMQLVVGTTSGFWIWTSKTLDSWRNCLCMFCWRKESSSEGSLRSEAKYLPYRDNQVKLLTPLTNV